MLDDIDTHEVIAELTRLLQEAEQRFDHGEVLPALSSLSAVPNLHLHLVGVCAELLSSEDTDATVHALHNGTYL